jgi:hypothetical protein
MKFLGHPGEQAWRGTLVRDDYSGYKALFAQGVTEAGCLAHARRKFHELRANHKSTLAEQALALFAKLYEVEREVAELPAEERLRYRPPMHYMPGWQRSSRGCRPVRLPQRRSTTASGAGMRWCATSKTATSRLTTTGSRTRSGRSPSGATTGCLQGRCALVSGPPQS